jgi:hypothetical protein
MYWLDKKFRELIEESDMVESARGYIQAFTDWRADLATERDVEEEFLDIKGYLIELAKKGIALGKAPTDKDAREFQKATGYLPYSLKIGNNTYTFDWAQPYAIPFSMGVNMYEAFKQSKNPDKALLESLYAGGETLFSQSMLQGLNKVFGGSTTMTGQGVTENLIDTSLSSLTQFAPLGSLTRKVSEATDPYKRDFSSDSSVKKLLINPLKNTYPGLRQTLPAKVDVLGEKMKSTNKPDILAPLRTLKPYNQGETKETPATKEIRRLYDTGQLKQIPRVANDKLTYKLTKKSESQKLELDPFKKNEYQEELGKKNIEAIGKLIKTSD